MACRCEDMAEASVADSWLTQLMGKPCWRQNPAAPIVIPPPPVFVYAKVAADDVHNAGRLEGAGFRLVDTNVQLVRPPAPCLAVGDGVRTRFARPADREKVVAIARSSFCQDRFHRDPAVPAAVADAIKAAWGENYFLGKRGDWMVVVEAEEEIVGFLLLLDRPEQVVIDLIATAPTSRRRGVATAMIAFALAHCTADRAMGVGTQLANAGSLRLYQRLGFQTREAFYILHHHG